MSVLLWVTLVVVVVVGCSFSHTGTEHFVSPVLEKSNAEITIEGVGKSKSDGVDVMVDILK